MFHPVGSQPSSVYWRRRLMLLGSISLLIILLVLTVKIAASDGGTTPTGAGGPGPATHPRSTPIATHPHTHTSTPEQPPTSGTTTHASGSASSTASAAPQPCAAKVLAVSAVVGRSTYHVGDEPLLELQVINTGSAPCVQDLADRQIELRVYNGESRVWGSHDCQIQPGTNPRTLAVEQPIRVAITWSGLTSQPNCAGTRQRVGAGTYTLYALLSGKTGKATTFTIS
jgi:hypothetical protein